MSSVGGASLPPLLAAEATDSAGRYSPRPISAAVDVRRHGLTSRTGQDFCGHAACFVLMDPLMSCALAGASRCISVADRLAACTHAVGMVAV
jgi:hypothetical protein